MAELQVWRFAVYGVPKAQGRPRVFVTRQGTMQAIDPLTSRQWKESVALQALAARPILPSVRPICLSVVFLMPIPQSAPKRAFSYLHIKKPDCSNLLKAIEDSLAGLYYRNDSQVCEVYVRKTYTEGAPGVLVEVREIDDFWHPYDTTGVESDPGQDRPDRAGSLAADG